MSDLILRDRALEFAALSEIVLDLESPLGNGTDGIVWKSSKKTAVKALIRPENYDAELACYQRLQEHGVSSIQGFAVPELLGHSDKLYVIEMGLVTPPFILDFAKASLDRPREYSAEVMQQEEEKLRDLFDADWEQVSSLLAILRWQYGIYYYDAKPANIQVSALPSG